MVDNSHDYFLLDSTNAKDNSGYNGATSDYFWWSSGQHNHYIAYCWHSVPGYSKIGKYVGNGNADGPFINLGFKPAWLMVKRSDSTDHWFIIDVVREKTNVMGELILANEVNTPTNSDHFDFISNGFKIRGNGAGINASNGTYIFMAFAEAPFTRTNAK